jgi:hypothetical protein
MEDVSADQNRNESLRSGELLHEEPTPIYDELAATISGSGQESTRDSA